jgi:rRNA maturation protein Nop10
MSELFKCYKCDEYTLKSSCPFCDSKTLSPEYKFSKVRDEPSRAFKRTKN